MCHYGMDENDDEMLTCHGGRVDGYLVWFLVTEEIGEATEATARKTTVAVAEAEDRLTVNPVGAPPMNSEEGEDQKVLVEDTVIKGRSFRDVYFILAFWGKC